MADSLQVHFIQYQLLSTDPGFTECVVKSPIDNKSLYLLFPREYPN